MPKIQHREQGTASIRAFPLKVYHFIAGLLPWASLILWTLFLLASAAIVYYTYEYVILTKDNRLISRLAQGYDEAIDEDARVEVLFQRMAFFSFRDRLDDALPLVEKIAQWEGEERLVETEDGEVIAPEVPVQARALYTMGNGRLNRALQQLEDSQLDKAPQSIRLAQDYYTRALRIHPGHWETRYNLDIASRLVRNLPRQPVDDDEEGSEEMPEDLWTQLPGLPRGLP